MKSRMVAIGNEQDIDVHTDTSLPAVTMHFKFLYVKLSQHVKSLRLHRLISDVSCQVSSWY